MRNWLPALLVMTSGVFSLNAQNDFPVGIFGLSSNFSMVNWQLVTDTSVYDPVTETSFPSSGLNQFRADGFNMVQSYSPDPWGSPEHMGRLITLTANNGLKLLLNASCYFKPSRVAADGVNLYNEACDNQNAVGVYHLDPLFDQVFTNPDLARAIWGFQLCEEPSFFHSTPYAGTCPEVFCDGPHCDSTIWKWCEIPPWSVAAACSHWREKLKGAGINGKKMVVMGACHGGFLDDALVDDQKTSPDTFFNPQDYVNFPGIPDDQIPDVYFEGSYFDHFELWETDDYTHVTPSGSNRHYLGKFRSLDYARARGMEAHAVIGDLYSPYTLNSRLSRPNGNLLWFYTYTSLIHQARGIWFWSLFSSYDQTDPVDMARQAYVSDPAHVDRFQLAFFPGRYQNLVRHLARELAFLNELGVLDPDPAVILWSKTDQPDPNGVLLVPSRDYLPDRVYIEEDRFTPGWYSNPRQDEPFGLRYSIRGRGDQVVMIISNPNPYCLDQVLLRFDQLDNPVIQAATGMELLFLNPDVSAHDQYPFVRQEAYKVHREFQTGDSAGTVSSLDLPFLPGTHILPLSFGPFDVHVLRFSSAIQPDSISGPGFWVYPNPSPTGYFVLSGAPNPSDWEVIDPMGRVIQSGHFSNTSCVIELKGVQPGFYFLRLKNQGPGLVKTLVIPQ